jgi:hypothetical protein
MKETQLTESSFLRHFPRSQNYSTVGKMQARHVKTKEVRFNDGANKYHEPRYNEEQAKKLWHDRADLKEFSYQSHKLAISVQFKQPKDGNIMSYANVFTTIYLSCMDCKLPSTEAMQYYVHWNRCRPERRGIERYCVRQIDQRMQSAKVGSIVTVLALQAKLVLEYVPLDQRIELIQDSYTKQVQPARMLARIQGIVDALAIKERTTEMAVTGPYEGLGKRTAETLHDSSTDSSITLPPKKRYMNQQERQR